MIPLVIKEHHVWKSNAAVLFYATRIDTEIELQISGELLKYERKKVDIIKVNFFPLIIIKV